MAIWVRAPTGRRWPGKGRTRPALTNPGGPVERHHLDLVAIPPWFAAPTKSPPCALVALGNVLLPRPQPSAQAVLTAKWLHWRSNGVGNTALPLVVDVTPSTRPAVG